MELDLQAFDFGDHAFDLLLAPLLLAVRSLPPFHDHHLFVVILTLLSLFGRRGFLLVLLGQADALGR